MLILRFHTSMCSNKIWFVFRNSIAQYLYIKILSSNCLFSSFEYRVLHKIELIFSLSDLTKSKTGLFVNARAKYNV